MSNIPDFVMQVQEVERQIEAQGEVTGDNWKDTVQECFYRDYMDAYGKDIYLYIHGGLGMVGKGLDDLLVFLDEKMRRMEEVAGVSADVTFRIAAGTSCTGFVKSDNGECLEVENSPEIRNRAGVVHNERHERDYWGKRNVVEDEEYCPGQYSDDMICKIMKLRSQCDYGKDL